MKRSKEKELLDLGPQFYSEKEYAQCLKKLFQINKLMGFFKKTVKILEHFPKNISLIDVGCGGGLFLLNLSKHYPEMHFRGVDISKEAIEIAENTLKQWKKPKPKVEFQLQKEPELNLEANSVDLVLMTLVCHHLEDKELISFLENAYHLARRAIIINDLQRHFFAYWFYKILSPLFCNRLISHDGLISIQRSFKRKELINLLKEAKIKNYRIKWHFPFWWNILILKEEELTSHDS